VAAVSEVVQSLVGAELILLATLVIFFGLLLFGPSKVTALLTRRSPGRWALGALWFIFSVLSGKTFYDRFWIWRECFDENDGRCYVTDVGTMTVPPGRSGAA
jgi:hypothetical protein